MIKNLNGKSTHAEFCVHFSNDFPITALKTSYSMAEWLQLTVFKVSVSVYTNPFILLKKYKNE